MTLKKILISCSLIAFISTTSMPAHAGDNVLGTLIGAAGGAAVGSNIGKGKGRVAAIAVGTLVGAGIGSSIGSANASPTYVSYNNHDRDYHRNYHNHRNYHPYRGYNSYYYNAPVAQSYWVNPAYQTQVVQVNNYQPQSYQEPEEYCREFNAGVTIGGKVQPGYGTACLQPDGSWKIKK